MPQIAIKKKPTGPRRSGSFLEAMRLLTLAEKTAIIEAKNNGDIVVELFLLEGSGADIISLDDPDVIQVVQYFVHLEVFSPERAVEFLASDFNAV